MAALTGAAIGKRAYELVWRMALLAGRSAMEVLVGSRGLMAAAAIPDARMDLRRRRVRIVAAHTAARDAFLGMIRVLVLVTHCARLVRRPAHVVRRMAAHTLVVLLDACGTEHERVFVAGFAGNGRSLLELMRLVAADALRVTFAEQGSSGDHRLLFGVTAAARGAGF